MKEDYPIYKIEYNPARDIQKVAPNGALDLKEAFANNSIPSDLMTQDSKFNGIDDPISIGGRVTDMIDAEVMDNAIRNYKPESNDVKSD